ncbi:hypothetical protein E4656_13295 [Natronospirillum operosum]|uniref:Uncharacterized protein n=1 Tax=Natronospirillum operosum TaxID=2759953 RepID=A0A4Z0WC46_9GAMM|nr:hypothetical protein [Natronospirillum operosum]TGG92445.1 hypothetical protein E4656_13295 [Natronospirillum operosum]
MTELFTRTPKQWAEHHLAEQPDAASKARAFSELPASAPLIPLWHQLRREVDPATLMPAAVRLLERTEIVPGIPGLTDFILTHHHLCPELQSELPRLAWIALDIRLLDQARAEDQPRVRCLFINLALRRCDFSQAADWLTAGYQQQGLRALDVVRYCKMSLMHPRFAPITQAVLPMLQEQRIINLSLVQVSLDYIQRFSHDRSSVSGQVQDYVKSLGPRVPHFESRVFDVLRSGWRDHCRRRPDPQPEEERSDGKQWDRWGDWKVRYTQWPLLEVLSDRAKQRWLRAQLLDAGHLLGNGPGAVVPRHSVQAFALFQMRQSTKPAAEDMLALGHAWQTLEGKLEDDWLPDRLASLFCLFWQDVDLTAPAWSDHAETLVPLATDLFARQIRDWLAAGGLQLPARVWPMPGIDLYRLKSQWTGSEEDWEVFCQGYWALLGTDGTRVIPDEPRVEQYQHPVRFLRLNASDGLQPLIRFLVRTPEPRAGIIVYFWRDLLSQAEQNHTRLFDRELARLDSEQQAEVARSVRRSMIFYEPTPDEEAESDEDNLEHMDASATDDS